MAKQKSIREEREALDIKRTLLRLRKQSEGVPGKRGALLRRKIDKGLSECDELRKAAERANGRREVSRG